MENSNEINGKKNYTITWLIVIICMLLVVVGVLLYLYFKNDNRVSSNDNNEIQDNSTSSDNVVDIKDNEVKKELLVYKSSNGDLCIYDFCSEQKYGEVEAFRIKAKSENAKLIASERTNSFILYDDNGIKIYDVKNNRSIKTTLENNYDTYEIYLNEAENNILGIGYQNEDFSFGYYNVSLKKKLYDNKYKIEYSPMELQKSDDYLSFRTNDTAYLVSSKQEKIELSDKMDAYVNYNIYKIGNSHIIALGNNIEDFIINKLYTYNKELFYGNENGEEKFSFYNGYIYINDNGIIKKYNTNGNLISQSSKYNDLRIITNNYAIYYDNNTLYLENIDNAAEKKDIAKNVDGYYIWSDYYTRELLDSLDEKNKTEGLYVVIEYSGSKDANGYYGIEYCYTKNKEIVTYPITQEIGGRAKPVLYLYPENDMKVNVSFGHPEYLTTTYPKYINSWNVYAKTNGDLLDENGKYYYALYWDEKRYHEVDFSEGFYVEKKDAINFLEDKLNIIGLNNRERNEFIMYWLPILERNEKNLVYFELTEERESTNKLIITPKPDSLLRLSIHIKKVNEKVDIKEEKLPIFKRVGFTAVEWGGMEY